MHTPSRPAAMSLRTAAFVQGAVTATAAIVGTLVVTEARSPSASFESLTVDRLQLRDGEGRLHRIHPQRLALAVDDEDSPGRMPPYWVKASPTRADRPAHEPGRVTGASMPATLSRDAHAITVKDTQGHPRMVFTLDEGGTPMLVVLDPQGRPLQAHPLDRLIGSPNPTHPANAAKLALR